MRSNDNHDFVGGKMINVRMTNWVKFSTILGQIQMIIALLSSQMGTVR